MKSIMCVTSEGPRAPAYIRFSIEPVASTEPTEAQDEVVVDYDAAGGVVGIELVSLVPTVIAAFFDMACEHDLELSALFTRSFAVSPGT
jgi:uncharacterized protein YuzE